MQNSFFTELQRRNVLRAAAFYAAAAWLLVQVATQVFPFFNISNSVVRMVVVAAIAGFPLALLFAWFYELTPEGIRRESQIDRSDPKIRAAGKRFDRWIIVALGLAVVLLLADRLMPRNSAVEAPVSGQSIAVLPFENLSADQGNAYFADGIQDEILTRLAKIGALKVISRTSTQQYAAKPGNLPEIARQLGVATVLEGSVQKVGNAVRVTVQLIKAATDEHLWAETYDRKLDDIFGVETEVAQAIASELQVKLSGGEQTAVAARSTANAAAYDAYLRARAIEAHEPNPSIEVLRNVLALYGEATRLDPGFALAWARLGIVKSFMYANFIDRTPTQLDEVKQAADTALRLQPELGEAYLALGYYRYRGLRDYAGGLQAFEQARQRLPNNADVLSSIGYIERRQGKWREAIAHLEQATALDPHAVQMLSELANTYAALREFAQARATFDRALAVVPDSSKLIAGKAATYQVEGDLDASGRLLAGLTIDVSDPESFTAHIDQLLLQRRFADALAVLRDAMTKPQPAGDPWQTFCQIFIAWAQMWSGDKVAAHASFVRALDVINSLYRSDADDINLSQGYAITYAGLGDEEQAMKWAKRGVELNAGDAFLRPRSEATLAQVLAYFGHTDAAIAMVPRLLEVPNGETRASMRMHPVWDPLRNDPIFLKLVAADAGSGQAAGSPH
ncbi:MAG TPA: tetratricopeptide repeat protein [Rhodanobacteraceae bacterium]|nr:tetratricopeptide repeat protein [Rhodanobacteraceae bacterium]